MKIYISLAILALPAIAILSASALGKSNWTVLGDAEAGELRGTGWMHPPQQHGQWEHRCDGLNRVPKTRVVATFVKGSSILRPYSAPLQSQFATPVLHVSLSTRSVSASTLTT
jgi:hypothetical protein